MYLYFTLFNRNHPYQESIIKVFVIEYKKIKSFYVLFTSPSNIYCTFKVPINEWIHEYFSLQFLVSQIELSSRRSVSELTTSWRCCADVLQWKDWCKPRVKGNDSDLQYSVLRWLWNGLSASNVNKKWRIFSLRLWRITNTTQCEQSLSPPSPSRVSQTHVCVSACVSLCVSEVWWLDDYTTSMHKVCPPITIWSSSI